MASGRLGAARYEVGRIVVAVDGSPNAERALDMAMALGVHFEAEVTAVHVASYPARFLGIQSHSVAVGLPVSSKSADNQEQKVRMVLDEASKRAQAEHLRFRTEIIQGATSVPDALADYAGRARADLLVVGTRGLGLFQSELAGSVARDLVGRALFPVLVVP